MKKKILLGLLIIIGLFTITGCGKNASTTNETIPEITGVNFKTEKNKLEQGDTIEITFGTGTETYTEKFMILKVADNQIAAMPYYNITQSTSDPKQSSNQIETGTLAFASSKYWNEVGINIDMENSLNNIEQYIAAYSTKLSSETAGKVTATIARYYGEEIDNISSFHGKTNSEGVKLLNPSGTGNYWIGSTDDYQSSYVRDVFESGNFGQCNVNYCSDSNGIRPIIIIDIS